VDAVACDQTAVKKFYIQENRDNLLFKKINLETCIPYMWCFIYVGILSE